MFFIISFILFFIFSFCSFYFCSFSFLNNYSVYNCIINKFLHLNLYKINILFIKMFFLILNLIISTFLSLIFVFLIFIFCLLIINKYSSNYSFKKQVLSSLSKFIIFFFRIKIKVHNQNIIPLSEKLIIYANHKSLFDPFILSSVLPINITFTPKDELYNGFLGSFLGFCFNSFDCIKIHRKDNKKTILNINKTIEKMNKKNLNIVVFHEGGRKNKQNDKIINSLEGSFKIAIKSQSSIIPISIKGSSDMIGKCWFRKKEIELFIHPKINFQDYQEQTTTKINKKVNNIINSVL
ncbi:lysophospholipid acyltransferase family protein [Candidatus Phytoplasma oryzae]|nr:lysophospholipid acyltransferase family protein [Candidatus Phytoplasma oryzae]